jgi:hypothetical protein
MTNKERELIKYTIILNRALPRRIVTHKRYFVDGRKLDTETIHELLKEAGHTVEFKDEECQMLSNKYKGIRLVSCNGGLMVYPKNKLNFEMLKRILMEDGYFFHSCYLPIKKKNDKNNCI